jgi:hypothetical protein
MNLLNADALGLGDPVIFDISLGIYVGGTVVAISLRKEIFSAAVKMAEVTRLLEIKRGIS